MGIGLPYPQKWCGQTQPHNPHTWVMGSGGMGQYASCAGYNTPTTAWDCRLCGTRNSGIDNCIKCNLSRDGHNYDEVNELADPHIQARFQAMAEAYESYMKTTI